MPGDIQDVGLTTVADRDIVQADPASEKGEFDGFSVVGTAWVEVPLKGPVATQWSVDNRETVSNARPSPAL